MTLVQFETCTSTARVVTGTGNLPEDSTIHGSHHIAEHKPETYTHTVTWLTHTHTSTPCKVSMFVPVLQLQAGRYVQIYLLPWIKFDVFLHLSSSVSAFSKEHTDLFVQMWDNSCREDMFGTMQHGSTWTNQCWLNKNKKQEMVRKLENTRF